MSLEPFCISAADSKRHYELFRAETPDGGNTWQFAAITRDSMLDNLRPLVPAPSVKGRMALLWLRGSYRAYTVTHPPTACA